MKKISEKRNVIHLINLEQMPQLSKFIECYKIIFDFKQKKDTVLFLNIENLLAKFSTKIKQNFSTSLAFEIIFENLIKIHNLNSNIINIKTKFL